jgi:hypothetical protein
VNDDSPERRSIPATDNGTNSPRVIQNISGTGLNHFVVVSPARASLPQLDPDIVGALVPVPAMPENRAAKLPPTAEGKASEENDDRNASEDKLPRVAAITANPSSP